jgi:hypothetical protein
MRLIFCPKCNTKLKPKESAGAQRPEWIKCPICDEIFKNPAVDLDFLGISGDSKPKSQAFPANGAGSPVKKWAFNYGSPGENERREDIAAWAPNAAPKSSWLPLARWVGVTLLSAFLVLFLIQGFEMALPEQGAAPPAAPEAGQSPAYSREVLVRDLLSLRRSLRMMKKDKREVNYSGFESRIYNYFSQELGKNFCQDIHTLSLYSEDRIKGLTLEGHCLDPGLTAAQLKVEWRGDTAEVSVAGRDEVREISLRPET